MARRCKYSFLVWPGSEAAALDYYQRAYQNEQDPTLKEKISQFCAYLKGRIDERSCWEMEVQP